MSRVLVVEDEAPLADGLRFNLQAEGHAVEVAADGESALERLVEKKERFDVVVLDVMLPGKSGFDVAALLREKKNYVPVLMVTARGGKMCCEDSRRGRMIICRSRLSWRF